MPKFSVNLSEEILAQVDAKAAETDVTRAEVIREAVTRYITQAAGPEASEDATQQNPEVTRLGERVRELEQALLDEREQRIQDLKTAEDRRAQETARFQVLLQGAQKALPPPRQGIWPSLKAAIWGRSQDAREAGEV